ncbi:recombinase family protein [Paenibacillus sp. FSL K6-1230]|uniref:recombinase family protein n=1 Tax=Paenibacillus sp. FSL K6-1230 TaxID=2921603 RepID=UPI0030FC37F8
MMIGYARVSSKDQNLERQIQQLQEFGCEYIVEEKESGATKERPILQGLLQHIRFRDVIVVTDLSRMVRSLKEHIDTRSESIHSQFVLQLLGALAEYERELLLERQREGIEIAKKQGKYKGRAIQYHAKARGRHKLLYDTVVEQLQQRQSITQIAKRTGLSRTTIYRIQQDRK